MSGLTTGYIAAALGAPAEIFAVKDRAAATAVLAASPDLAARLTAEDHRVLTDAADHSHTEAVRLMLDLGFPPGARFEQDNGATALHLAAAAASTGTVRLLLDRGADIETRDTAWNSTRMEWAIVGSGMRLGHDPDPDWPATVSALLDAGAPADGIVLAPPIPNRPAPRSPPYCAPAESPTRRPARPAARRCAQSMRSACPPCSAARSPSPLASRTPAAS